MNPKVDFFFNKPSQWQEAYGFMRKIALDCNLTEELKWGVPCYTFKGNNVVLIHGFKEYCAFLFHKGVLLKDTDNLLIQQTDNVQSARQIRFTEANQIAAIEKILKTYIFQAIEVEKAGLKVPFKKTKEYDVPDELTSTFKAMPDLKKAFESLTPGRQRGYLLHFSQPKLAKTRVARIEKCIPLILKGKGLND